MAGGKVLFGAIASSGDIYRPMITLQDEVFGEINFICDKIFTGEENARNFIAAFAEVMTHQSLRALHPEELMNIPTQGGKQ